MNRESGGTVASIPFVAIDFYAGLCPFRKAQ
jgi:hypothetical protein